MAANMEALVGRLETVASRLEKLAGGGAAAEGGADEGAAANVGAYKALKAILDKHSAGVKTAAEGVKAPEVQKSTDLLLESLTLSLDIVRLSAKYKKPSDQELIQTMMKPIMDCGKKAADLCDNRSDYFSNCKFIAEILPVSMFVLPQGISAPYSHIGSYLEAGDFHGNKVLLKKIDTEKAWVNAVKNLVKELRETIKDNDDCEKCLKMCLMWNMADGKPLTAADLEAKGAGAGAAAPPAPAAAAAEGATESKKPSGGFAPGPRGSEGGPPAGGGMASVFGQLAGMTASNLRKVKDEEKTKNRPKEETTNVVKASPSGAAAGAGVAAAAGASGRAAVGTPKGEPSKVEARGNWNVDNYANGGIVEIEEATMKQGVYISNSNNTVFNVKGKVKTVVMDSCSKCKLVVNDVLSGVEIVNCQRIAAVQVVGAVNSLQIDKTDGCQVFVCHAPTVQGGMEGFSLTTSKSSEMNVSIAKFDANGEMTGDFDETPIPEQFVTKFDASKKQWSTGVSDIYG